MLSGDLSLTLLPFLTLATTVANFAGGALLKQHQAVDHATDESLSRVLEDNKALNQLLDTKKQELAEANFNKISLTRQNQRLQGIIEGYEKILQNRNPDLEKDLDAMYAFIHDARTALNIPDENHPEEVRV